MSTHRPYMEPRRVAIVGAGEQAELAYEYFTFDSPHEVVCFGVESRYRDRDELYGLPVVALEELPGRYPPTDYAAFVAVSSTQLNRVRTRLYRHVKSHGYECVSYVSSHAFVWRNVHVGENTFIFENNVLQHHVRVGDNVVLWSTNHIGHRSVIHDNCFLTSHVVVAGFCDIGDSAFLGVNASVNENLRVGADCVVGAGAVVIRDTEPRGVYVGNPARPTGRDSFETFGVVQG